MTFDPSAIRGQFPALNQVIDGAPPVFLDGPGGTQAPQCVLDAITGYLARGNANLHKSPFFAIEKTHEIVRAARENAAAFLNASSPDEIIFGANMSSITAHLGRSISLEWKAGDEIIVTALDHLANISYWKQAAEDRGVKCHMLRIDPEECSVDYAHLEKIISPKTKLVAFSLASNVCGTLSDAKKIIKAAQSAGALTFVDAVHYAPHFLPDVRDLDCDFLACSAYKFFGPHIGFAYGKKKLLDRMSAYKVELAPQNGPEKWETGTKNFEALAGFSAAVEYIAALGQGGATPRKKLEAAYKDVGDYERRWSGEFLSRAKGVKGLKVYGVTDMNRLDQRTATFALAIQGRTPQEIADSLARQNISTGAGHFYGVGVTDALGLTDKGGVVRVGCVHYNTLEEMDRFFNGL